MKFRDMEGLEEYKDEWACASPLYENPEKCGFEIVGMMGASIPWEFRDIYVFRHLETNKLYWCYDSGCSCPGPLEGIQSIEDLNELEYSFFEQAVNDFVKEYKESEYEPQDLSADATELLSKVSKLI